MKKKIILLSVTICLIIAIIGIIHFNTKSADRMPSNGFYVMEHKGYYAFQDNEAKIIGLDVFFVNNKFNKDNELIQKYNDFRLVSSDGTEFPFLLSKDDINYFQTKQSSDQNKNKIFERIIPIDISTMNIPSKSVEFVKLKYKDDKGLKVEKNLGKIKIDILKDSNDMSALSARPVWQSIIIPTFTSVRYNIENISKSKIEIKDVDYNSIEVSVPLTSTIILNPSEYKEYEFGAKLTNEKTEVPIIYELKPKFTYVIDGITKNGVFANAETDIYRDNNINISEYLYQKEKSENSTK
ncbi:MAG TPA: hypothetical protein VIK72_18730 [Clostridiaceae bacterium]